MRCSLHQYIAQSMVLLVHSKDGGIGNLGVLGMRYPAAREQQTQHTAVVRAAPHFFSPSSSRKASNVAGAFMADSSHAREWCTCRPLNLGCENVFLRGSPGERQTERGAGSNSCTDGATRAAR